MTTSFRKNLRTAAGAAGLAVLFVTGGLLYGQDRSTGIPVAVTVEMTDSLRYLPQKVTVTVGQTVAWKNTSRLVHTVTADYSLARSSASVALPKGTAPFNSGPVSPGNTWKHTFTDPGTYRYFCIPHEADGMVGEVTVVIPPSSCPAPVR